MYQLCKIVLKLLRLICQLHTYGVCLILELKIYIYFFAGIIDTNPTTRKLSTFFTYLENKSMGGITNLVHDSLRRFRRFRRRNYNPPRHATQNLGVKHSKPRRPLMNYENYEDYVIDDYDY